MRARPLVEPAAHLPAARHQVELAEQRPAELRAWRLKVVQAWPLAARHLAEPRAHRLVVHRPAEPQAAQVPRLAVSRGNRPEARRPVGLREQRLEVLDREALAAWQRAVRAERSLAAQVVLAVPAP